MVNQTFCIIAFFASALEIKSLIINKGHVSRASCQVLDQRHHTHMEWSYTGSLAPGVGDDYKGDMSTRLQDLVAAD